MNKSRSILVLLSLGLVVSNLWWAYQLLDQGITLTYMQESYRGKSQLLTQTLSMLPVAAEPSVSQDEIIAAAQPQNSRIDPFEKEGFVWVGRLGLQFNDEGQLIKAVAGPDDYDL